MRGTIRAYDRAVGRGDDAEVPENHRSEAHLVGAFREVVCLLVEGLGDRELTAPLGDGRTAVERVRLAGDVSRRDRDRSAFAVEAVRLRGVADATAQAPGPRPCRFAALSSYRSMTATM